jgi:hypothetical protein
MSLKGISQTNTKSDSVTCLPNRQLREAIKDIERGKICKEEVILLNKSIDILTLRLNNNQEIIKELKEKSILQDTIISLHKINEIKYKEVISNNDKTIKIYKNKLAWNKGLKFIYAAGGLIAGILLVK